MSRRRGPLIGCCGLAASVALPTIATVASVLFGLSGRAGYSIAFMFAGQVNAVLIGSFGRRIAIARAGGR